MNAQKATSIKSIRIWIAKFLCAYLITLIVGGIITVIKSNPFGPKTDIASSLGALTGSAIGYTGPGSIVALLIQLIFYRKFDIKVFLFFSLAITIFPWLANYLPHS
jgi:hypothetical protein